MDDTVVLERLFRADNDLYRIQIRKDLDPASPREFDNTALLLTWESGHASPDGRDGATPALDRALDRWKVSNDFLRPVRAHLIIRYLRAFAGEEVFAAAALSRSADGLELLLDFNPAPGGWYDGLALVPAERWKASMGDTPPKTGQDVVTDGGPRHVPSATEVLRQEVDVYNQYLRGEIYEYLLERAVLGGWAHVDSCSGMMGDVEQCGECGEDLDPARDLAGPAGTRPRLLPHRRILMERSPCQACPWRTANRGKPHPDGWYTMKNIRRLWAGMRRGEHMTCHPTDPRNPVSEAAQGFGYRPAPSGAETLQCVGAVILQQREVDILQRVYGSDISAYRRGRPRGLTKRGLTVTVLDRMFGGTPFGGGAGRFSPDLNEPVWAPGLDWPVPKSND